MSCSMDQSHVLSLTCGNRHQTGTDKTWTPSFGPLHMSNLDPLLDPSFGPLRENFSHSLHPPFMEFFLFFLRMRRSSSAKGKEDRQPAYYIAFSETILEPRFNRIGLNTFKKQIFVVEY